MLRLTPTASPGLNSRQAACGCEGYPAPQGVNVAGEGVVDPHNAAMGTKGGNQFKRLRPEQVAAPVPHEAGRGGREREANHKTHGRLYAGNDQQ